MPKHIDIPVPQWKPKKEPIPETAGQIIENIGPEAEKFLISFRFYNHKLDEMKNLDKNGGKRALENLKTIGCCGTLKELSDNGIHIDKIRNGGEYSKLFNRLTPETELREHKIQGASRIFFFITESQFNVVAITNAHYRTD